MEYPSSTKIITKIHCRAYFHRKLDYRKQDIIEDCMQDQHCWRCFIFIHLENIVLRSFVDVQGVFYRTQVSLGSGLWVPVSLFKYIHFGVQLFIHFSAQTQLCSKKLFMWFQWFKGSKLWPNNTVNTKICIKIFFGLIKTYPPPQIKKSL